MSRLDTSDEKNNCVRKAMQRVKTKQLIHVQLVISFTTFPVMDRPAGRVGSQKPHKLTGRVTAFVGRVGSGLEIWTRVQLWAHQHILNYLVSFDGAEELIKQ